MLAQVTAFELLCALLVVGFISALSGWAGGAGARLSFSARVDRVEGVLLQLLNRAKGAAGGVVAQRTRERTTSAEKEAEALAEKLANAPRRSRGFGLFHGKPLSAIDAAEEASFEEIERDQAKARAALAETK